MVDTRTKPLVQFALSATGTGVAQDIAVKGADYHIKTDAYPSFGGKDEYPSPLAYALAALTSCNQVVSNIVSQGLGITIGHFAAEVEGDLDPSVIGGGEEGNANFTAVRIAVTVKTDATPEQFETLKAETERRCPVSQLFIRSGLEYTSTWTAEPLA